MDKHADITTAYARLSRLNGICHEVFDLPSGPFYIFADEVALRLAAFEDGIDEKTLARDIPRRRNAPIRAALEYLDGYVHGVKAPLPPMDLSGYTKSERAVYRALLKVPFGRTISYADLARRAGFGAGARFAGNCMAKNDFPVFIPCHRVVRSDGGIGRFSGGPGIKELLLGHEGSLPVRMRGSASGTRRSSPGRAGV
ncbi:MAG: methylated-DNA--[protein]-cysteine S-methyltransferase [Spirochaetota bacterium]|jgi:methylated-DNA-[protein]-cysteine S-methyltransferase